MGSERLRNLPRPGAPEERGLRLGHIAISPTREGGGRTAVTLGTHFPLPSEEALSRDSGTYQTTFGYLQIKQRWASEWERQVVAPKRIGSKAHHEAKRYEWTF